MTYFFNATTGERTWTRPASQEGRPPLPGGWSEGTDPRSGVAYYYHVTSGVRQWTRPAGAPPPAAPRHPPPTPHPAAYRLLRAVQAAAARLPTHLL